MNKQKIKNLHKKIKLIIKIDLHHQIPTIQKEKLIQLIKIKLINFRKLILNKQNLNFLKINKMLYK